MSLDEAARQLKMAGHDAQVAFDCIGIGELERAQEHAITARAAADAAEMALRTAMADLTAEQVQQAGDQAIAELKDP
ncbi:MAG TPA: hypothetical protein VH912_33200 [Streptosporangiaceae bacterium]|jgi:hypothetical protein